MVQLRETRLIAVPIDQAFDYTANFANLQEWDPGIAASARTSKGPVGLGSRFDVLATFGSRQIPMVYEITEFDGPHRVVLEGTGGALTAIDEIRFTAVDGGTQVDYTADLEFSGLMRLFVPFLGGVMRRVGEKALDGLESRLGKLEAV
jgi:carbon monoxide dehydrogenase subunit G